MQKNEEQEHALDAKEVAKRLGTSYRKVLAMAEAGDIASFYVGREIRFRPSDVERYIETHRRK